MNSTIPGSKDLAATTQPLKPDKLLSRILLVKVCLGTSEVIFEYIKNSNKSDNERMTPEEVKEWRT